MNKVASLIITLALMVSIGIIFSGKSENGSDQSAVQSAENVEIKNGVQYITINARGGYLPRISKAQANIPTKLIVKTNSTYDCSLSLVIRSIGYQKILSPTGEEVIDLNTPQVGTLQGLCGMGMYNFAVNFN
jgi:plastocyanin domain-containing protein